MTPSRSNTDLEPSRHALTDCQLAWIIGAGLFALVAWPLLFMELPPYQDLYAHCAGLTVLIHPERYPEFESTGMFKTYAMFYTLGRLIAPHIGVMLFAKIFRQSWSPPTPL